MGWEPSQEHKQRDSATTVDGYESPNFAGFRPAHPHPPRNQILLGIYKRRMAHRMYLTSPVGERDVTEVGEDDLI